MGPGVVRSYQQAFALQQMPVNLIGVAISTAFFPKLSEEIGQGDENNYHKTLRTALRTIIWIAMPIAIITFFTRGYIVAFIRNGGDMLIASILGAFVIAIFCTSIFHIAARGFYARQNTRTPFLISVFAIGISIGLAIWFSRSLDMGPEGIAYAHSIGSIIEVTTLLTILQIKSRGALLDRTFWSSFIRTGIASLIAGAIAYSMTRFMPLLATDDSIWLYAPKFFIIASTALISYVIAGYFLNIDEANTILFKVKKLLFRNVG